MKAKGFEYDLLIPSPTEPRDSISTPRLSLQDAQNGGYPHINPTVTQSDDEDLNLAIRGSEDAPVESAELLGTSQGLHSDGCLAAGYGAVYPSVPAGILATTLASNSVISPARMILSDQSFLTLEEDWHLCMQNTPFKDLRNPGEAYDVAARSPETAIEIAVTDATCREALNYDDKLDQLLARYLTSFAELIEPKMLEVQHIRTQATPRAETILLQ